MEIVAIKDFNKLSDGLNEIKSQINKLEPVKKGVDWGFTDTNTGGE